MQAAEPGRRQRGQVRVHDGLPVPGPQLVTVELGTTFGSQRLSIDVEQLPLDAVPIRAGCAEDDRVGQIPGRVPTPDDLPVQQSGLAVAKVRVARVRIAVQNRVRTAVHDGCSAGEVIPDVAAGLHRDGRRPREALRGHLHHQRREQTGRIGRRGLQPAVFSTTAGLLRQTAPEGGVQVGQHADHLGHLVGAQRVKGVGELAAGGGHVLEHDHEAPGQRVERGSVRPPQPPAELRGQLAVEPRLGLP